MNDGMIPGSGMEGLKLLINNYGQISGVNMDIKDFDLVDEKINDNKLFLTFRYWEGSINKYVWKTDVFSFRSKWSVADEHSGDLQLFKNKFPNLKSDIINDPVKIVPTRQMPDKSEVEIVKTDYSKPDSILGLDKEIIYNNLKLRIKKTTYGSWAGKIYYRFQGWKMQLEFNNKSDSVIKIKVPQKLIDTSNTITGLIPDRSLVEESHLNKYQGKYTINTNYNNTTYMNGKISSGSIESKYLTGNNELILKSLEKPNTSITEFYNYEQKIQAILNQDFELSVYPNTVLSIDLYYKGQRELKPMGLIME